MAQQTMRAAVVRVANGPQSVEVVEVERPEPGLAQVRVKVCAAALNPVDAAVWAGAFGQPEPGEHFALGWDFSGVVDAVGPMANTAPGDAVIGYVQGPLMVRGAQAEYVVVPSNAVAPLPPGVDLAAAATIPLPGLTAAQGLELLNLRPGAVVAIAGAAGAVGGYAVELAKTRGLRVVGVDRPGTEDTVRRVLGADDFVTGEQPAEAVRKLFPEGVDAVLDAASLAGRVIGAVRDGGGYVTTDPRPEFMPPAQRDVIGRAVLSVGDGSRLATLAHLAATDRLSLRVARTYPLDQAREAHAELAGGKVRGGKILLTM